MAWSGETKRVTRLIEVTVLTQGKRERRIIRATHDHPFRLRSGEYRAAADLREGDRLLSIERGINHAGYRRMYFTGCYGQSPPEHVMVAQCVHGAILDGHNVHHRNEVKIDNRPDNLCPLSPFDHAQEHGWTPEQLARRERSRLRNRPRARPRLQTGRHNPRWYDLDPTWAIQVLRDNNYKPTAFRDIYGMDYECVVRKLDAMGIDWRRMKKRARGREILTKLPEARKSDNIHAAARILGVNYYRAKRLPSRSAIAPPWRQQLGQDSASGTREMADAYRSKDKVGLFIAAAGHDGVRFLEWLQAQSDAIEQESELKLSFQEVDGKPQASLTTPRIADEGALLEWLRTNADRIVSDLRPLILRWAEQD